MVGIHAVYHNHLGYAATAAAAAAAAVCRRKNDSDMYYQALQAEYTEGLLARQVSQLQLQHLRVTCTALSCLFVCEAALPSVAGCDAALHASVGVGERVRGSAAAW
jgi:hypothetical protein